MKARTLELQTKIYSSMDENAVSFATLPAGSEIEFGAAKRKSGKLWVPITLSTGQQAYIPGDSRIYVIQIGNILQNNLEVHAAPSSDSLVKQQLPRNARVYILQVIKGGEKEWVQIRDMNGIEGYIPGDTRIRVIPQKTKAMGMRNIRSGVMWLIAGSIIVFSNNAQSTGSIYFFFGYVALVFGVATTILGVVNYLRAPS